MTKRGLTGNERRVLYGLVRYPTLNDRELSERLAVKVSTVTTIRGRLRRGGYYVSRRIPMLHRLGWEIMAAGHVPIDASRQDRAVEQVQDALKDRLPNLFHIVAAPDHVTFLAVEPDYTALRTDVDGLRLLLDKAGLLGKQDVSVSVFAMPLSAISVFFDFSRVLAMAFGFVDERAPSLDVEVLGGINLTRKETDVLKGLVRYPDSSDKALGLRVKVSRQAVSKMRRRFEAIGLLRSVRIPDLRALDFDMYVAGFSHFRPKALLRRRTGTIESLLRTAPVFLVASCDAESVILGAAKDYAQFSALRSTIVRENEERDFLVEPPTVYLGLMNSIRVLRNCEFGPLVQKIRRPELARAPPVRA